MTAKKRGAPCEIIVWPLETRGTPDKRKTARMRLRESVGLDMQGHEPNAIQPRRLRSSSPSPLTWAMRRINKAEASRRAPGTNDGHAAPIYTREDKGKRIAHVSQTQTHPRTALFDTRQACKHQCNAKPIKFAMQTCL